MYSGGGYNKSMKDPRTSIGPYEPSMYSGGGYNKSMEDPWTSIGPSGPGMYSGGGYKESMEGPRTSIGPSGPGMYLGRGYNKSMEGPRTSIGPSGPGMYSGRVYNESMEGPRTSVKPSGPYTLKKFKVCGSEKRRRRMARLKAEGITDRNAYLTLKYPRKMFPSTTKTNSNGLGSDLTSVNSQLEEKSSEDHMGNNVVQGGPSCSKPLLPQNVAIVPQNYPKDNIPKDNLNMFRDSLAAYIDRLPDDGFLPKLNTVWSNSACVLALCKDLETVEWLTCNINQIKPWNGADLEVISTDALAERITLWVPGSKIDRDLVLKRIQRQNEDLEVTSWHVVELKNEEGGLSLELLVDKGSVKKIQDRSWSLYCGAVKAEVKPNLVKHSIDSSTACEQ